MLDSSDLFGGEGPVKGQFFPISRCQLLVGQLPKNGSNLLREAAIVAGDAVTARSFPPPSSRRSQLSDLLIRIRDLLKFRKSLLSYLILI